MPLHLRPTRISTLKRVCGKALWLLAAASVGACSSPLRQLEEVGTDRARITATPNARPQRTITNFTESLRCMDDKLAQYEVSGLLIGAQEVYSPTVEVAGTKDMLLTSLSTMSRKSKAFGIVALGSDLSDVSTYFELHGNQAFRSPDFFVRLGAPQIDKGVQTEQVGGGVGIIGAGEVQRSKDQIASIVSIDMNLGTVGNLQLLPGIYSSNSISVVRKGAATDLSGEIRKLGAVFRISNDKSEGFHHSVRTLVELGAIEIVGRLTQIPYWECLDIESTNPAVQAQVQDWYSSLDDRELLLFTQSKLAALKYYDGPVDGGDSAELRSAIAQYKSGQGLVADGDINFLLYYKLIIDKTPVAPQHIALLRRDNTDGAVSSTIGAAASRVGGKPASQSDSVPLPGVPDGLGTTAITPLEMTLSTDRGSGDVLYRAGEEVVARVEVSSDAHVFCYYQQGDGGVLKIFPNRFQSSSRVSSDQPVDVPGSGKFSIRADTAGQSERIMCLASYQDIDQSLPFQLRDNDLELLPVKDLNQVYGYYRSAATTLPFRKIVDIQVTE